MLVGLIDFVNSMSALSAESVFSEFDSDNQNIKFAFNCNSTEVLQFKEKVIQPGDFSVGVS